MAKKAPHEIASATFFNAFAEGYLSEELECSDKILSVPGVAGLLLEEFNNEIIEAFDEEFGGCSKEELT